MLKNQAKLNRIRHSLAHIMAVAVKELYPRVKFGIGPAIENGFYYDFDFSKGSKYSDRNILNLEDLPKIEKRMKELIKKDLKFEKKLISKAIGKKLFKNQPYKLELIKETAAARLPPKLSVYQCGDFIDLCKGPHIKSTKEINPKAFKLTKIAGAYWRGDEKNPMLTRIYGIAFETWKELNSFQEQTKEAEKRDHRVLGEKLDLFHIDEAIGPGLILWHPKGALLKKIIEDYVLKEYVAADYQLVNTPHIAKLSLWKTSGHTEFYKESMFPAMNLQETGGVIPYQIKPMNCPFHIFIYKKEMRSYRVLPIRYTELGTVYRYEKSGVLHGLTRVRGFTQDDAHIFCTPEQLAQELTALLRLTKKIFKTFGFKEFEIYLSTRPKKYVGALKNWQKATNSLKYALEKLKLAYQTDPGEGVFYGPKIDIKIKDSLERAWQCTTIQVDFNLPEKFNIFYINKKGKKQQPIMIHRALLGSLERFIGIFIEHCAGAFPSWLAPEQVWIIPVGSRHKKYAQQVAKELAGATENCSPLIRSHVKDENETVSKKIRDGEMQKIPYLLVVGDKEMKTKSVRVRQRGKGDIGQMKLTKFLQLTNNARA